MLKFCDENKGAISVFLTLILLPTLFLGGLTTDAARIYASKVVITDAGEMAMNAALAQYDTDLLDEYGLFAMEKTPEEMEDSLEVLFERSLNGSGLEGIDDYDKILDLVSERFDVINLEASKIYKTEVEKQQIIEYMKYRAPVCLTELVLEKLDILKNTKQITDAMEAQMDFAEDMEECQDTMEDAKIALDNLNTLLESYPNQSTIENAVNKAETEYRTELTRCMLILGAIANYTQSADMDGVTGAEKYIEAVNKIDFGNPTSDTSFEAFMSSLFYRESAGKLGEVISAKRAEEPEEDDPGFAEWYAEMQELEELDSEYQAAKTKASGYRNSVISIAKSQCIEPNTQSLTAYYEKTLQGIELAKTALDKLEIVEEKLKDAERSWKTWDEKTGNISDSESMADAKQGMQDNVDEYREFFGSSVEGYNSDNANDLGLLIEDVKTDKLYFEEIRDILKGIKFFDHVLVLTDSNTQYNTYLSKAKGMIGGDANSYDAISEAVGSYASNYVGYPDTYFSTSNVMMRISSDPFYLRLIEYCNEIQTTESETAKNDANQKLSEGKTATEDSKKEDDDSYPTYKWTLDDSMPSVLLSKEKEEAEDMANVDGNVGKSGRKNALKKAKESISNAASFLDKLDSILTEGISNLYVAEYAMQMFSYYTVDKQIKEDGTLETIPEDQVLSLSGYKLAERDAYKAEVEYILWGNAKSQTNIRNTVMTIFAIRLLLNSIFAFTNETIVNVSRNSAQLIASAAPYLVPLLQAVIQFGFACAETSDDINDIKEGYGVAVLKDPKTWASFPTDDRGTRTGDNTKGDLTLDYSEFLRIFLNINMLGSLEANKLARIGDCIQVNLEFDFTKGYTMLAIESEVKSRTTFMRQISEMNGGGWEFPDDRYTIQYQSILGY